MAAEFLLPYLFQHGGLTIDENDYFGDIDSLQAEAKCCNTGYYLVRHSAEQNNYFLTINWKGKGIHIPIQKMFNVSLVSMLSILSCLNACTNSLLFYPHSQHMKVAHTALRTCILKVLANFWTTSVSHRDQSLKIQEQF